MYLPNERDESARPYDRYASLKVHDESSRRGRGGPTPEYRAWCQMIQRCHLPSNNRYRFYGARGIAVCAEWRADYMAFLAHVGRRPSLKHSIDRKDSNRNYEPGNVRWATPVEQARNRRNSCWVTIDGETLPVAVWSQRSGVPANTIRGRLKSGWDPAAAVSVPVLSRSEVGLACARGRWGVR